MIFYQHGNTYKGSYYEFKKLYFDFHSKINHIFLLTNCKIFKILSIENLYKIHLSNKFCMEKTTNENCTETTF